MNTINTKVKLAIAFAVIIVLGFAGYALYNRQKADIITEKDPNLSSEDRKTYEDKLSEQDRLLAEAKDDNDKFDALMQQGFYLYGLGKYQESKDKFFGAVDVKPQEYTAFTALYEVQMAMNDNKGAQESISKAISLKKDSADLWKRYIVLEKDRFGADKDKLNGLYIEALRETRENIDIITSYAAFLESVDNLQASKEYWQKAVVSYPANKAVYEAEITRLDTLIKQRG
jgi:tetratricopeptide (TPR) repeat protein